jgi:hypothetical protein
MNEWRRASPASLSIACALPKSTWVNTGTARAGIVCAGRQWLVSACACAPLRLGIGTRCTGCSRLVPRLLAVAALLRPDESVEPSRVRMRCGALVVDMEGGMHTACGSKRPYARWIPELTKEALISNRRTALAARCTAFASRCVCANASGKPGIILKRVIIGLAVLPVGSIPPIAPLWAIGIKDFEKNSTKAVKLVHIECIGCRDRWLYAHRSGNAQVR